MTTRIELKEMRFYAYHGVMPQETKVGNNFVVNLILTAPLEQAVRVMNWTIRSTMPLFMRL